MLPKKNTHTLSTKQLVGLVGALAVVSAAGGFIAISALSQSQTVTVPAQAVTPIIANAAASLLQTNTVDSAIIQSTSSTHAGSLMNPASFATDGIALKQ